MLSVGLDLHKRYSQVEAIDEGGQKRAAARIGNEGKTGSTVCILYY